MDLLTAMRRKITYNAWANGRLLEDLSRARDVPEDALRLAGHVAGAERLWLGRLLASSNPPDVWPQLTVEQLDAQLHELDHAWRGFAQSLSPERLSDDLPFANQRGETLTMNACDILSHVLNHSTYHRGQIARILKQAGHGTTNTDLLRFAHEHSS